MTHTSSITIITLVTLCMGWLVAGSHVAQAKGGGLIFTEKRSRNLENTFIGRSQNFIDLGAPGADPTTITVKTKKKKGQAVAVWFRAVCQWYETNANEIIFVRFFVDGVKKSNNPDSQCIKEGPGLERHMAYSQTVFTLGKGTHTIQVEVDAFSEAGEILQIENVSVIVFVQ